MGSAEATRPASTRIALARLAERVIAADPGVGASDGRGRWLTRDGERDIAGVVAAAAAGRVDVELHLIAYLPPCPLEQQAAKLRAEIVEAAGRTGLGESLGQVDIAIHDLGDRREMEAVG